LYSANSIFFTPNQYQLASTNQPAVLSSHNKSAPATSHSTANKVNVVELR